MFCNVFYLTFWYLPIGVQVHKLRKFHKFHKLHRSINTGARSQLVRVKVKVNILLYSDPYHWTRSALHCWQLDSQRDRCDRQRMATEVRSSDASIIFNCRLDSDEGCETLKPLECRVCLD